MKKVLTIFLSLVFIVVLKSFFTTKAYSSEEWTEKSESETNILETTNIERCDFAEHKSAEITLQTEIEIDIELVSFWSGKNSDILIIRLMTETGGLTLTYYNDVTLKEGAVGILQAEYSNEKEEITQSARLGYEVGSEITGIAIRIAFKEGGYFISFETRIKYESGTLELNQEELNIDAEEICNDPATLTFELVGAEAPGWNPEVKIVSTILQITKQTLVEEEPPKEEPLSEELPKEAVNEPEKQDQSDGTSIEFPETGGNETVYPIAIAAGGGTLLTATAVLIIKKRRKV